MSQQIAQDKSSTNRTALTLAYWLVATVMVCAYCGGLLNSYFDAAQLINFKDVIMFACLFILGLIMVQIGASAYGILPVATIFGFIVLTFQQEPLIRYLTLGAVLFAVGMYGMVVSRNAVRVLMSIELMLNAVNINLVAFSRYTDPHAAGQVFAIFILTVAAAEAAVGLGIVLAVYRNTATIDMDRFNLLKW